MYSFPHLYWLVSFNTINRRCTFDTMAHSLSRKTSSLSILSNPSLTRPLDRLLLLGASDLLRRTSLLLLRFALLVCAPDASDMLFFSLLAPFSVRRQSWFSRSLHSADRLHSLQAWPLLRTEWSFAQRSVLRITSVALLPLNLSELAHPPFRTFPINTLSGR